MIDVAKRFVFVVLLCGDMNREIRMFRAHT